MVNETLEVRLKFGDKEFVGTRTAVICGLIMADASKERREAILGGAEQVSRDELDTLRKRGAVRSSLRKRRPSAKRSAFTLDSPDSARALLIELMEDVVEEATTVFFHDSTREKMSVPEFAKSIASEAVTQNAQLTRVFRYAYPDGSQQSVEEMLEERIYLAIVAD